MSQIWLFFSEALFLEKLKKKLKFRKSVDHVTKNRVVKKNEKCTFYESNCDN